MILGESGTGKSVIAREIHDRSQLETNLSSPSVVPACRRNCWKASSSATSRAPLPARSDTWGKVRAADGGTLFLDEIGELPMEIQPKLLRLLQEREYERVGENKVRRRTSGSSPPPTAT